MTVRCLDELVVLGVLEAFDCECLLEKNGVCDAIRHVVLHIEVDIAVNPVFILLLKKFLSKKFPSLNSLSSEVPIYQKRMCDGSAYDLLPVTCAWFMLKSFL